MRFTGTVKFFSSNKGYGFIIPRDGGAEVFVHAAEMQRSCHIFGVGPMLYPDDVVSYVLIDSRNGKGNGKKAGQVEVVSRARPV